MSLNTLEQGVATINAEFNYYKIVDVPDALNENNEKVQGYAIVNVDNGTVEFTSTYLPGIIFQAQQFDNMLTGLLNPKSDGGVDLKDIPVPEDVVPS